MSSAATPCSVADVYSSFGGIYCFHFQVRISISDLQEAEFDNYHNITSNITSGKPDQRHRGRLYRTKELGWISRLSPYSRRRNTKPLLGFSADLNDHHFIFIFIFIFYSILFYFILF
jgi:hypothetical protein